MFRTAQYGVEHNGSPLVVRCDSASEALTLAPEFDGGVAVRRDPRTGTWQRLG
jgi:hypothetical protein